MSDAPPPPDPDLNETVLDELAGYEETLLVDDLVRLTEEYDEAYADETGVPVDRLVAYVEELARNGYSFDPDAVREQVDERAVESDSWAGSDAIYRIDGDRVSAFPPSWHEELGGESDLVRLVEVILAGVGDSRDAFEQGGQGRGVPLPYVVDAATAMTALTREQVTTELRSLRRGGALEVDQQDSPERRIRPADAS
jgi:hypothetical protein